MPVGLQSDYVAQVYHFYVKFVDQNRNHLVGLLSDDANRHFFASHCDPMPIERFEERLACMAEGDRIAFVRRLSAGYDFAVLADPPFFEVRRAA